MREIFLGIDGGGTKTTCLAVDRGGVEVAREIGGPTNPNVVTLPVAAATLVELVRRACSGSGSVPDDVRGAVFGLAGVRSGNTAELLARSLRIEFGQGFPVEIETDARVALEGALRGGAGMIVIAGTGSTVMAKTPKGEIIHLGGWGRIVGDEGSGYFLGVEAVKAFTKLLDGRVESPLMNRLFSERLGWTSRDHLITAVYVEKIELSTLAPIVFELASLGDTLAQDILQRGTRALAEEVLSARARITMPRVRLATLGGLIDKPTVYREILAETLRKADPTIEVCMPERTAAEGAAQMARERRSV